MYPKRFATGIRSTTIPNPARLGLPGAVNFQGTVGKYKGFSIIQAKNFAMLQAALMLQGTKLGPICAATYDGIVGYNSYGTYNQHRRPTRFVAASEDGRLMWEKYDAQCSQSGQNYVFAGGQKVKVSTFLGWGAAKQKQLLNGKLPNGNHNVGMGADYLVKNPHVIGRY